MRWSSPEAPSLFSSLPHSSSAPVITFLTGVQSRLTDA